MRIVETPGAWKGPEIDFPREGLHLFRESDFAEIDRALRHLKSLGNLDFPAITPETFPLDRLGDFLRSLRDTLRFGRGFVLLRGIPREAVSVRAVLAKSVALVNPYETQKVQRSLRVEMPPERCQRGVQRLRQRLPRASRTVGTRLWRSHGQSLHWTGPVRNNLRKVLPACCTPDPRGGRPGWIGYEVRRFGVPQA